MKRGVWIVPHVSVDCDFRGLHARLVVWLVRWMRALRPSKHHTLVDVDAARVNICVSIVPHHAVKW